MTEKSFIFPLFFVIATNLASPAVGAEANCTQNRVDGTTMPTTGLSYFITPAQGVVRTLSQALQSVVPFYQWENDNGYCGEASMIQAGLNNGQWMSQFNARKICGTGLAQSGSPGTNDNWCSTHHNIPNYNAQLLLEDPNSAVVVSGPNPYANAAACLANSRLSAISYPYSSGLLSSNIGLAGYQDYMSWIKRELLAGHQVTIGVLLKYGTDPQYDHEVTILAIGTNYLTPDYNSTDVLYFDDHGAYTLWGANLNKGNPAIPYGSGGDNTGCTPYVFGYTFGSLPQTRKGASVGSAQAYSILIPGVAVNTSTGADGYLGTVSITSHNYAFSVLGAMDNSTDGVRHLLPIQVTIPRATYTNGAANPQDPEAGWEYENSMIGTDIMGKSCTNTPPQYWMAMSLQVTVYGLTPGQTYNLYEYDRNFTPDNSYYPAGTTASLAIPMGNFNANRRQASQVTRFTASGPTFTKTVSTPSNGVIVFRAVPADAP